MVVKKKCSKKDIRVLVERCVNFAYHKGRTTEKEGSPVHARLGKRYEAGNLVIEVLFYSYAMGTPHGVSIVVNENNVRLLEAVGVYFYDLSRRKVLVDVESATIHIGGKWVKKILKQK